MVRVVLFAMMMVMVAGCATTPLTEDAAADDAAVRAMLQAYVDRREARDIDGVRALLDDSVDQLTSRGEWRRGVDAATAGMQRSSATAPGTRTLIVESVRFLSPDVALADARYVIAGIDSPDRVLWSSFTLVRQAERWQITSIRNMEPANPTDK